MISLLVAEQFYSRTRCNHNCYSNRLLFWKISDSNPLRAGGRLPCGKSSALPTEQFNLQAFRRHLHRFVRVGLFLGKVQIPPLW